MVEASVGEDTTSTSSSAPLVDRPLMITRHRVQVADTDSARFMYYGAVYIWAEGAFTEWLVSVGHRLSRELAEHRGMPVVRTETEYLHPMGLDDVIELQVWPHYVGRTSFAIRTRMFLADSMTPTCTMTNWHTYAVIAADGVSQTLQAKSHVLPRWLCDSLTGARQSGAVSGSDAS